MHIPDFYEHYCPTKIVAGQRSISNLPFEMGRFGPKRAMIVADKAVSDAGFLTYIEQAFTDSDRAIGAGYSMHDSCASMRAARTVAGLFVNNGCDCFIAVGSGHAMDTAKAACLLAGCGGQDLPGPGDAVSGAGLARIFAVPVTYSPGFQVTDLVSVYDEEKKAWAYVHSEGLIPSMAVVDPKAAYQAAPDTRAAYAMNALCRAVEASLIPGNNPVVKIYAQTAIELIRKYLPSALSGGAAAKDAQMAMANASLYAGIAFSHTSRGILAGASHALALISNIDPGIAGAVLLPYAADWYARTTQESVLDLGGPLAVSGRFLAEGAQVSVITESLKALHSLTGLPGSLRETGVIRGRLKQAAQAAAHESCPYYRAAAFSEADALDLLEKAF